MASLDACDEARAIARRCRFSRNGRRRGPRGEARAAASGSLPPIATFASKKDSTMRRLLALASSVLALTSAPSAFADDAPRAEPPATRDVAASAAPSSSSAARDLSFQLEPGVLLENTSSAHLEMALGGRVGKYVTPNIGVFGGLRGSIGADSGFGVLGLQVPVLVEYALRDAKDGFYVTGGVGLMTLRHYDSAIFDVSADVISPVDGKLGAGVRVPRLFGSSAGAPSLDVSMMLDVGYYAIGRTAAYGESSSFAPNQLHETLALNVGLHW